jgi:hypothetical protein
MMGMASLRVASAMVMLLLTASAEATELDRLRALDRARQDQRAAFDREFAELRRQEPERIRAENGRVRREGDELSLGLGNGGRTFFRDDESQCLEGLIPSRTDGCVAFFFIGHALHFYLVRARYDAGSDYRLVDDATGAPTKIPAEPHFSPDGARLVTVIATDAYDHAGIEIWSTGAGEPAREWKYEPSEYAIYSFVRWDGNANIALEVRTYVEGRLQRLPAHLVLGETGWIRQGPAESSRY